MSKGKKGKKEKKETVVINLTEKLRNQADEKNCEDCDSILSELNLASIDGEYNRTVKLKVNQAHYIKKLGLTITEETNRSGYYQISWE